ncbi:FecR domain-containing protein [Pseudomonas sp. SWRI18]|uniref:FecR family protein n=1 Tax=Pseudomonas sp. SWRI18 TaxID=2753888 RepID=UPI0016440CF2|nr:FecR domain-containing protein [Pseudomonas sp. SWRI18]MBC3303110.1 FecR domain-containing protein [Pseudomonas sp. SWRI18]
MSADLDQQAANWVIRLNEGNLSEREHQQLERWKAADPRHAAAFERMQGFVGRLQALRPQQAPVQAALEAVRVRRRNPAGRVLLGLLLALPVVLALRAYPPSYLLADQRTAPAQWQRIDLQDGSQLTLSGNSAVDLTFDGQQRQVRLLRGEILVQVAHDATRPFTVVTDDGQVRALGTRFTVKRESPGTLLGMLESKVAATGASQQNAVHVSAGEQARITPDAVTLLGKIDPRTTDDAWQRHQLVVQDWPLPQVLDELARQYGGHVQFDREQLADLRVSAVLPLDNPRRALQLIADGLPVRIRAFSPLWLQIERVEK